MNKKSLVEQTEKKLLAYLNEADTKAGSPFPTEKELGEELGVSRTVVREALNRLKAMGIIDSRTNRGSVVASPDILHLMEKAIVPQILDQETLKEIFELRLVLEVGMSDLVFMRTTRTDLVELHKIVEEESEKNGSIFDVDHEVAFHGKLYELTGNSTLSRLQSLLLPSFQYVYDNHLIQHSEDTAFMSHKDLIHELENGTAESFRNGMRKHLENHYSRLFAS
ncbi:GntR family transcriptional regulator [Membranicola marinus]|uniref:GntR family transcriptional regulator n=1 Tax=Membranihabitans marinus TaxID=1227546 RepID=A0A953HW20_9BACT|nr:GntR family transcriptional regulator [Membranihabitans marinus]MBY5959290.1 GntR family transcriptional regulator [Membranihabitans marinus]